MLQAVKYWTLARVCGVTTPTHSFYGVNWMDNHSRVYEDVSVGSCRSNPIWCCMDELLYQSILRMLDMCNVTCRILYTPLLRNVGNRLETQFPLLYRGLIKNLHQRFLSASRTWQDNWLVFLCHKAMNVFVFPNLLNYRSSTWNQAFIPHNSSHATLYLTQSREIRNKYLQRHETFCTTVPWRGRRCPEHAVTFKWTEAACRKEPNQK